MIGNEKAAGTGLRAEQAQVMMPPLCDTLNRVAKCKFIADLALACKNWFKHLQTELRAGI